MLRATANHERTDEPAIRAVDDILAEAIECGASDLHVQPNRGNGSVRIRVDGKLQCSGELPAELLARVTSRIKLLAGMDISDRRAPQDGRFDVLHHGHRIDLRVSSLPTIDGERLAIRILDRNGAGRSLAELGMTADLEGRFREILGSSSGFVIVCGATGSGKTTTLYASLRERNAVTEHICSVEDPVELRTAGVVQVQVNVRAGLTFPVVLRAFLRQDPDVLVVGEMRDAETADVAISAALCGRLVLTTLHATNALVAFERLRELGVGARPLASAVSAVLAQRLVSRSAATGSGRARTARFELAIVSEELRYAIQAEAPPKTLRDIASRNGYRPMLSDEGAA
ncbi:MAG TPA: GspE/PulE family protein [Candidatus Tumulicola sp.]|jgi:type II secretory ATPase GspE/PulE/Tfp pilus assembly ATPase PilB-like protein